MSASSNFPSTSVALLNVYSNVLQPLFLPSPSEFSQPLLDSFIASHDELLEDKTLFTSSTRVREIGVLVDGVTREFRRREEDSKDQTQYQISLDELRKLRLRSRLQSQAGPRADAGSLSKQQILKNSQERREAFDADIGKEEEEALKTFKDGLRKAVIM